MDNQQNNQQINDVAQAQPTMGMKWYKFLIYFALFAGAVLNLISGVSYLNGTFHDSELGYEGATKHVYLLYPGLKTADILYGIAIIIIAVLAVVTRFALAKYKKNGPTLLLVYYAVGVVAGAIYTVAAKCIISENVDFTSAIISLGISVGMVILNKIYFDKRKHLFVN